MTDEEIRAALLEARAQSERGFRPSISEPNHVVVRRDLVEGDLEEIDRWVDEHGYLYEVPGEESSMFPGGLWQQGPVTPPSLWYVVRASALES